MSLTFVVEWRQKKKKDTRENKKEPSLNSADPTQILQRSLIGRKIVMYRDGRREGEEKAKQELS